MTSRRLAFFSHPDEFHQWLEGRRHAGLVTFEVVGAEVQPLDCTDWLEYFSAHDHFWLGGPGFVQSTLACSLREDCVAITPPYIDDGVLYMSQISVVVPTATSVGLRMFNQIKRSWESSLMRPTWATAVDGGAVQEVRRIAYTAAASIFADSGWLMVRDQRGNRFVTSQSQLSTREGRPSE